MIIPVLAASPDAHLARSSRRIASRTEASSRLISPGCGVSTAFARRCRHQAEMAAKLFSPSASMTKGLPDILTSVPAILRSDAL